MGSHSSHTCPPSQNTQINHIMEETQPLSNNESFSYNWLMNVKKPVKFVDSPGDSLRFSLDLEADHSKSSMKCADRSSFHFDLPGSGPTDISVADQMIRNGSLVPLNLIDQQNNENHESNVMIPEDSVLIQPHLNDTSKLLRIQYRHVDQKYPITPNSSPIYSPRNISVGSNNSKVIRAAKHTLHSFEGPNKKPSKKIVILKCFRSLLHFCKKVKEFGLDEVQRVSPRTTDDAAFRTKSGCSSPLYDVGREHAIREAILHCKSSSRKYMVNL